MKEKLKIDAHRATLKQLRALTAVVRQGTFSAAAEALSVTPPAVTVQMKALEELAGLPLVERTREGLRPTDAGRVLLETASRIEAALEECGEALDALHGVVGGRVSVGVISTAKYFAPRALAVFSRGHPNIEMRLSVGNRGETVAALRDFQLDFAVMGRPPEEFKVSNQEIGAHPHIVIAPPDHPMVSRRRIALAKLADETFLLREEGSGTRTLMQRIFAKQDLSPNLGMEIGSNETIKQAVIAGLGIALISAHTVAAELGDGRLAKLDIVGLPVVRKWYVVRRREKTLLPAAQALWDFLVEEGARFLPVAPK